MGKVEIRTVGVIGLGYVGLPVAVAFAEQFPKTVGFDVKEPLDPWTMPNDVTYWRL